MKVTLLLISTITLVAASGQPGPGPACPADKPNETSAACANRCENTCDNIGEAVTKTELSDAFNYCFAGCFCKDGFIRNDDGDCVKQKRSSCDSDPCEDIPHTLWKRCVKGDGPTCYIETCNRNVQSKCACKPGYALNLDGHCIKKSSRRCRKLAKTEVCSPEPESNEDDE